MGYGATTVRPRNDCIGRRAGTSDWTVPHARTIRRTYSAGVVTLALSRSVSRRTTLADRYARESTRRTSRGPKLISAAGAAPRSETRPDDASEADTIVERPDARDYPPFVSRLLRNRRCAVATLGVRFTQDRWFRTRPPIVGRPFGAHCSAG